MAAVVSLPMTTYMTLEAVEAAFDDVMSRVEAGETIDIMRDGKAVARLRPAPKELADEMARSTFVWPTPRYPEED